jgi:hypothetical protein
MTPRRRSSRAAADRIAKCGHELPRCERALHVRAHTPVLRLYQFGRRWREEVQMIMRRLLTLGFLSLATLITAGSQSHADWSGTCSCKSEACHGRWELRAESMKGLRDQCIRRTGDNGFLSRVHRQHHRQA